MNALIKLFSILFFGSALISCGDHAHNHTDSTTETHAEEHGHSHLTENHANLPIELNNGEKWLVNEEMKPHVEQGESALNEYITSNNTDYKSLAEDLKSADKKLISSCTMDGKSHDELHKWLEPHLGLVSALETADNEKEADRIIDDLKNSYYTYHTYFK